MYERYHYAVWTILIKLLMREIAQYQMELIHSDNLLCSPYYEVTL